MKSVNLELDVLKYKPTTLTHLSMEQIHHIALMQRHQNFKQELLVFLLQRQSEPVDDTANQM